MELDWIAGHVLRMERNDDCMMAMNLMSKTTQPVAPEGKRKVGRRNTTWRGTV